MNFEDYLRALAQDSSALAAAALGDLTVPVAACPGWSVRDVVVHTGNVHQRRIALLRQGLQHKPEPRELPDDVLPTDQALPGWVLQGADQLVDELRASGPDRVVWSWSPDHSTSFWARRMAQETAVHRWDAQEAIGDPDPILPPLAADGIDEFLRLWLPEPTWEPPPVHVHLHCHDTAGEWLVDLSGPVPSVTAGPGKGDAALRGTASDLLLVLWRRVPLERVEVLGDRSLAQRFVAHADLDGARAAPSEQP